MIAISPKWFSHSFIDGGSGVNHECIMVFLAAVWPANTIFLKASLVLTLRSESSLHKNKVGCIGIGNSRMFSRYLATSEQRLDSEGHSQKIWRNVPTVYFLLATFSTVQAICELHLKVPIWCGVKSVYQLKMNVLMCWIFWWNKC